MSENTPKQSKGLMESLSTLASTLVAIVHTRLDLLSTDLEEDREHLLALVMLSLVALFSLLVGVVLVAILLVVTFWETHRLLTLGLLAGFFLMVGFTAWLIALRKVRTKPKLFSGSLLELLKDRQKLDSQ